MEVADATNIFLSMGEEISMIKAVIHNCWDMINRSYPKNHVMNKKIWDLHHSVNIMLCCELDSNICKYYPMTINHLGDKSLTSIFYTTASIENPFKDKPYEHRRTYSKQLHSDEKNYIIDMINTLYAFLFRLIDHKDLFTGKSQILVSKLIKFLRDYENFIQISPVRPAA